MINFVASVVSHFDIDTGSHRVGAVSFGSYANVEFQLNQHASLQDLVAKIETIRWRDEMTNTSGGIRTMRTQVFHQAEDRPDYRNIGIVITDGASNRDADLTGPEAATARQDGIEVFVVGVGNQLNMEEVHAIANHNTANMILASDFDTLHTKVASVVNRLITILGKKKLYVPDRVHINGANWENYYRHLYVINEGKIRSVCCGSPKSGGRFNIKISSYQYRTSSRLCHISNGNPYIWKDGLYNKRGPCYMFYLSLQGCMWYHVVSDTAMIKWFKRQEGDCFMEITRQLKPE